MALKADQLDEDELPDRFTCGRPSTSTVYHTRLCPKTKTAIAKYDPLKDVPTQYIKAADDRLIEIAELDHCSACQKDA